MPTLNTDWSTQESQTKSIGPAMDSVVITPSDTVNIAASGNTVTVRGIYVGTVVGVAGKVTILTPGGNTVTFVGLLAGVIYPIAATRVNATNTDATNLVGLF